MCSAHCLMVLYICERFHQNIWNGFQLTEQTQVHGRNGYFQCSEGSNSKSRQTKLPFISSAHCLIVLYICVKFCENISYSFQLTEWTQVQGTNGYVQCSKGNNSKSTELQFMCSVHCLIVLYICEVWWKYLRQYQSYENDTNDGSTDGWTDKCTNTQNSGWYNIISSPLFVAGHNDKRNFYDRIWIEENCSSRIVGVVWQTHEIKWS